MVPCGTFVFIMRDSRDLTFGWIKFHLPMRSRVVSTVLLKFYITPLYIYSCLRNLRFLVETNRLDYLLHLKCTRRNCQRLLAEVSSCCTVWFAGSIPQEICLHVVFLFCFVGLFCFFFSVWRQLYYPSDTIFFLVYKQGFLLKIMISLECHAQRMRDRAFNSIVGGISNIKTWVRKEV